MYDHGLGVHPAQQTNKVETRCGHIMCSAPAQGAQMVAEWDCPVRGITLLYSRCAFQACCTVLTFANLLHSVNSSIMLVAHHSLGFSFGEVPLFMFPTVDSVSSLPLPVLRWEGYLLQCLAGLEQIISERFLSFKSPFF